MSAAKDKAEMKKAVYEGLDTLTAAVWCAVWEAGLLAKERHPDKAIMIPAVHRVVLSEFKSFLFGEEYAIERDAILSGAANASQLKAAWVASCVLKVKAATCAA